MQKICSFSGHRSIPSDQLPQLEKRLEAELCNLIHCGFTEFRAGGALGFDTLAAQAVLCLREQYPQIRLILYLPCKTQNERWSQADPSIYREILCKADEYIYTSERYSSGCMHKRNRAMIDGSHLLLCYLTGASGGTAYTVKYAKENDIAVSNLAKESEERARNTDSTMNFFHRGVFFFLLFSIIRERPQTSYQILKQLRKGRLPMVTPEAFYVHLSQIEMHQYIMSIRLPCEDGKSRYFLFQTASGEVYFERLQQTYSCAMRNLQQTVKPIATSS